MTDSPDITPLAVRSDKRLFDLLLVLGLTLAASPLLLLLFLLILLEQCLAKSSRGPVLYREDRISHGKVFSLLKFRTVKQSAIDEARQREGGLKTVKDLEKVAGNFTHVGKWLNRLYLDELPQLFNILRGDMSIIGPRPWPPADYEAALAQGRNTKGMIPCGLTGLYQCQKGHTTKDQTLDQEYIDAYRDRGTLSLLWLDITILARSAKTVLEAKGL